MATQSSAGTVSGLASDLVSLFLSPTSAIGAVESRAEVEEPALPPPLVPVAAPAPVAAPRPAPIGCGPGANTPTIVVHHGHAGRLGWESAAAQTVASLQVAAEVRSNQLTEVRLGPVLPVKGAFHSRFKVPAGMTTLPSSSDLGYLRFQNHGMHGELTRIPEADDLDGVRAVFKKTVEGVREWAEYRLQLLELQQCLEEGAPTAEHYSVAMWLKAEAMAALTMKGGHIDREAPGILRRMVAEATVREFVPVASGAQSMVEWWRAHEAEGSLESMAPSAQRALDDVFAAVAPLQFPALHLSIAHQGQQVLLVTDVAHNAHPECIWAQTCVEWPQWRRNVQANYDTLAKLSVKGPAPEGPPLPPSALGGWCVVGSQQNHLAFAVVQNFHVLVKTGDEPVRELDARHCFDLGTCSSLPSVHAAVVTFCGGVASEMNAPRPRLDLTPTLEDWQFDVNCTLASLIQARPVGYVDSPWAHTFSQMVGTLGPTIRAGRDGQELLRMSTWTLPGSPHDPPEVIVLLPEAYLRFVLADYASAAQRSSCTTCVRGFVTLPDELALTMVVPGVSDAEALEAARSLGKRLWRMPKPGTPFHSEVARRNASNVDRMSLQRPEWQTLLQYDTNDPRVQEQIAPGQPLPPTSGASIFYTSLCSDDPLAGLRIRWVFAPGTPRTPTLDVANRPGDILRQFERVEP